MTEHKNRKNTDPPPRNIAKMGRELFERCHSQLSRGRAHVNVSWVESIFERIRFTFGPCFQLPLSVAIFAQTSLTRVLETQTN